MNFMLGCNYWASHVGTKMWADWDAEIVKNDLEILAQNGVEYLRVFPNWRDFQPVMPLYTEVGGFYEYRMEDEQFPENPYFLAPIMLDRFEEFCKIAESLNLKLIVGLLTGWMSGRLIIPTALYEKNLYTDPTALLFEQKFIRGFVTRMKSQASIYAWDLGNECNCLSVANTKEEAFNWTYIISNSIRAFDASRPIISGMHSLKIDDIWNIADQGEATDMLTTHPYPYWVPHCSMDKMDSIRTLLHATAETELYSSISGKPCLVEEIGSMGPMVCNDIVAADFMRVNLFSNWSNHASGVMWWCAHEQSHLDFAPYSWNMCERELGLLDSNKKPKEFLTVFKDFKKFLETLDFELPKRNVDGVIILSKDQDHWGVGYMTYILGKQAGLTLTFAQSDDSLPDADLYLLPSILGHHVLSKGYYDALKKKVSEGATLYISNANGFLTEFSEFTGLSVVNSQQVNETISFTLDEETFTMDRHRRFTLESVTSQVLAFDELGIPALSCHDYGKGEVYYLNFPLEESMITKPEAFVDNHYKIYNKVFSSAISKKLVQCSNPVIGITEHPGNEGTYIVIINYSSETQRIDLTIDPQYKISKVFHGDTKELLPCESGVFLLTK